MKTFMPASFSFFIALLLAGSTAAVRGQSALDGFDPNANFFVRVVATQPDGKILLGGDFTTLSPTGGVAVTRNRIARLNSDGLLDTAFDPNANDEVDVIVVQPDGKILIGGIFTTLAPNGGAAVARTNIARLNSDGSLDTNFNANANAAVSAIAVQSDGKFLVGGSFTSIGGQMRNGIARLDPATGAADSFNPNASGGFPPTTVNTIVVQADGRILAGGTFTSIGGAARNYIARLDPTTGAADSFSPIASAILGGSVRAIVVQPDTKILVGGGFATIGGQTRNNIARLDATTGAADSFNPNADNAVRALAVQPDGRVLIGGDFGSVGGMTTFMARLNPVTGAPEAAFNPGSNERVVSIAVQADGKILAGGFFTTIGGTNRNRIARLEADGRLDRTLDPSIAGLFYGPPYGVFATAVQPDGKILIGGSFTNVLGVARNNIARLNTDGTLDTAFDPNARNIVYSIAVQADGKILVSGLFSTIGGQTRPRFARLNPNGTADSFNPNPNNLVWAIVVQADGKILVGGAFSTIGGQSRTNIARLDATNGLADSFNPNANKRVFSIAVQADGKILAGGEFTTIGGTNRNHLARLDAATGLADFFNPDANTNVWAIAAQADGKILVGGSFTNIGGQTRHRIARLDAVTGLADSFDPDANSDVVSIVVQADAKILAGGTFGGTNSIGGKKRYSIARLDPATGLADSFDSDTYGSVYSIAVQADGKILAGGDFYKIGGQERKWFARLSNDTRALQNLAVSQTTITWTRGGSSPQLTRATFETSTNNVNYTPLGNGTVADSDWTLTGLNLPTGTNTYIRARGFYRGGYLNGSESITESVRNVFLIAQPLLGIQRSANTNVVLSWATNFTGFTLESNTNLTTNVWSFVSPAPVVSGTNNVVTNTVGGSTRFYRLRK